MKMIIVLLSMVFVAGLAFGTYPAFESQTKVIHWKCGGSGSQFDSVVSASGTHEIFDIPEGTAIENVFVLLKTAVAGSTAVILGDGDDDNGYIETGFQATPLLYPSFKNGATSSYAGDYLNKMALYSSDNQANGAKYYADDDTLDLKLTGTCTAGEADIGIVFRRFETDTR